MSPFEHHARGSMSPQRRARVFAQSNGRCHKCKRRLGPADYWIVEHVHALSRGGTDEDANLGITCEWCLPEKNADDAAATGRMRRSYTRHVVPKEFRQSRWRR